MKQFSRFSLALLTLVTAGACGSNPRAQLPAASPAPPPVVVAPPQPAPPVIEDPIVILLATSSQHMATAERELALGHLERAKAEFDRAIDVLLQSPMGARSDPRAREHFDRLVDRISALEMTALAQGDGFAEKKYEAASIDELLEMSTFERPAPAAELQETVRTDLETTEHDVPIPLNARVLSYIELFQGRLREFIQDGMTRGSRYLPMIQNVFRAEGLPLDLAYIPLIESAFKPNALSRAKAKGVWQFMRGTALENGLKHDWYIDERSDPEKATVAAAKYLRTLNKLFNGDWHLALASYNGGPGRVQRAVQRARTSDFWNLTDRPKYLPRETREYVPMILAAIIIAKNPVQYGFEVIEQAPVTYEKVTVPRAVDLRRVAEWTGSSIDEIQALNPELRRWTTPVKYPNYEVKVPVGTAAAFEERLQAVSTDELSALKWYSVKRGESLVTIARKLRVSRTDLAEANHLTLRSKVRPGQALIIPRAPSTVLATRLDRPAPTLPTSRRADATAVLPDATVATAEVEPDDSKPAERAPVVYLVKRGDTLFSIARLYRTTVAALKAWNNIRGSRISTGDRLAIFPPTNRGLAGGR